MGRFKKTCAQKQVKLIKKISKLFDACLHGREDGVTCQIYDSKTKKYGPKIPLKSEVGHQGKDTYELAYLWLEYKKLGCPRSEDKALMSEINPLASKMISLCVPFVRLKKQIQLKKSDSSPALIGRYLKQIQGKHIALQAAYKKKQKAVISKGQDNACYPSALNRLKKDWLLLQGFEYAIYTVYREELALGLLASGTKKLNSLVEHFVGLSAISLGLILLPAFLAIFIGAKEGSSFASSMVALAVMLLVVSVVSAVIAVVFHVRNRNEKNGIKKCKSSFFVGQNSVAETKKASTQDLDDSSRNDLMLDS